VETPVRRSALSSGTSDLGVIRKARKQLHQHSCANASYYHGRKYQGKRLDPRSHPRSNSCHPESSFTYRPNGEVPQRIAESASSTAQPRVLDQRVPTQAEQAGQNSECHEELPRSEIRTVQAECPHPCLTHKKAPVHVALVTSRKLHSYCICFTYSRNSLPYLHK